MGVCLKLKKSDTLILVIIQNNYNNVGMHANLALGNKMTRLFDKSRFFLNLKAKK